MIFFVYSKLNQRSIADNVGVPRIQLLFCPKRVFAGIKATRRSGDC